MLAVSVVFCALAGCHRDEPESNAVRAPVTLTRSGGRTAPNVVWLSIESLRADHVGCYGYERPTTPTLDALAGEGTVYTQADSVTSWTLTAHASMFTGLYPAAHGVIHPKDRLSDEAVTVAEVLRDAGYQTAGIVSGPYLAEAHNLQQGFTYFDPSPISRLHGASADVTNPDMEAALQKFLRSKRDGRPFLLFAYYWDTHSEYIPPPPFDTMFVPADARPIKNVQYMPAFKLGRHIMPDQLEWLIAQYDGEIRCTDGYVGRLFDELRELGLWENTMVIVTADHGEEFYEHGRNSHKNSVYVESVHVPLIIKWPRSVTDAPAHDDRMVSLVDLYPTILDVAGCSVDAPLNGRALRDPVDRERPTFLELATFWSFHNRSTGAKWIERTAWTGIRAGRHKLVHIVPLEDRAGVDLSERWELYDIVADPGEHHPLDLAASGELFGDLQGQIAEWRSAMAILARRWTSGGGANLSREEEQRLRGLGYVP